MTNEELFFALKEAQKICNDRKECKGCVFDKYKNLNVEDSMCILYDKPYDWELGKSKSDTDIQIDMSTDNLSAWHDGYDTGYKVGKNDTLLKVRDYINEMRE